jgi:DNA-directed RNA polymerase specialized sigma24 family protein
MGRALAALPELPRAVVLRHVDDLSYAEMSEALGRTEGTLKSQVHRGLGLLRAAWDAAEREEAIA